MWMYYGFVRYKLNKQYRLPGFDYASEGCYFVTICSHGRKELFGRIRFGRMGLSELGNLVAIFWQKIPDHFGFVKLDEWVVMPNHVHGIIEIDRSHVANDCRNVPWHVPTKKKLKPPASGSLSLIINHFKGAVTKTCRDLGWASEVWQPRFYDHVIRNDTDLNRIREYIINNPLKLEDDKNNVVNLFM